MEKYVVYEEDFYKGYSRSELRIFRKHLDKMQEFLDKEDLESALNCIMDSPYITMPEFTFYRINLLIRLERIKEALDVANDEQFKTFRPIQAQREGIAAYLERIKQEEHMRLEQERLKQEQERKQKEELEHHRHIREEEKQIKSEKKASDSEDVLTKKQKRRIVILFTKIYIGDINFDDIKNAEIDEYSKILLSACYYDKFNHATGAKYLKSVRNNYDGEKRKTLNKLMVRLEDKKNRFFDISSYASLLGTNIDIAYARKLQEDMEAAKMLEEERNNELNRRIEEEIRLRREEQEQELLRKKSQEFENQIYNNNNSRPIQSNETECEVQESSDEVTSNSEMKIVNSVPIVGKKKSKKTIREVFSIEAEVISAYFYDLVNNNQGKEYVRQYNNFESLIDNRVDKAQALKEFERIVQTLAKNADVKVKYEAKKFLDLKKR